MQQAGFQLHTDAATKRADIRMFGHWSADIVAAFDAEVQAARLALVAQGCLPGECLLLIDARDYLVQTQEITRTFEKLLSDSEILAKKIAFLPPVGLAKIQTKRLISKNPHKFFDDFSAAEEWLRAA